MPSSLRLIKALIIAHYAVTWCVAVYLSGMFLKNGIAKFDSQGIWSAPFARWGFPVWFRMAIGVIETVGGVMLVVPPYATYAGVAIASVMVGAAIVRAPSGYWNDVAWIVVWMIELLWIAWVFRGVRWRPAAGGGYDIDTLRHPETGESDHGV